LVSSKTQQAGSVSTARIIPLNLANNLGNLAAGATMQSDIESIWAYTKNQRDKNTGFGGQSRRSYFFSLLFLGNVAILLAYFDAISRKVSSVAIDNRISFSFPDLLLAVFGWSRIMQWFDRSQGFREHFRIYCSTMIAGRIPGAPWHLAGRAVLYKQIGSRWTCHRSCRRT
jgi:hypothetical protein